MYECVLVVHTNTLCVRTHVLCSLAELKMEPDTRRGKKKPAKAASPNKTGATKKGAKGAKVAVVVHDEPEPAAIAIIIIADPWLGLRSPLGGRLSPAEEWKRLQDAGSHGRELTLTTGEMSKAALEASTTEEFRLATNPLTLENGGLSRQEEGGGGGEEIGAGGVVVAASPTAPKDDDGDRQDDDRPVERLVLRGEGSVAALVDIKADNADGDGKAVVGSGCARRLLTTALVKIDLAGTGLDDAGLGTVVAALTPWLRELSAPGNSLTRIPHLRALGKLQVLDLSKNSIDTIGPESFPSELGPTLRSLNLEGNRLDSLLVTAATREAACAEKHHQGDHHTTTSGTTPSCCALRVLTSLVELNLSSNRFESSAESLALVTRAGFPRLLSLDLRGNCLPRDQESDELQRISKTLPTLKSLNGEEVSRQAMTIPSSKGPLFELLSTGDRCVKEGRREESCSCAEGNACAVAYLCRDWPNRFEVAAAAAAGGAGSRALGQKH